MLKIFELIGRYFMLMGKVFSRPEKAAIYRRRIIFEMESLGVNSIGLTAIISVFIVDRLGDRNHAHHRTD